ncbi:hypothetical protein [Achromobacter pestifer]
MSSFILAFQGSGSIGSICVKFAMFDRTTRLSYWDAEMLGVLAQCLEYYSGTHFSGSDLQRAVEEPGYVKGLAKRHPVRTMTDERPHLAEADYQAARRQFSVASFNVNDGGALCRIECTYGDGRRRIEFLPAFIAMHLCTSLKTSSELCRLLAATPGGMA